MDTALGSTATGGAEVRNDAQVYGDAKVHGSAKILDTAHVYENADVSGSAVIKGTARITGGLKIGKGEFTSGTFDGITESVHALEQMYRTVFIDVYRQVSICKGNPDIVKNIRNAINLDQISIPESADVDRKVLDGCIKFDQHLEILRTVLPTWTSALPLEAGQLSVLIKLIEIAQDMDTTGEMVKFFDELQQLYAELKGSKLCGPNRTEPWRDCPRRLDDLLKWSP